MENVEIRKDRAIGEQVAFFLASGSIWFGLLGGVLQLAVLSSNLFDWKNVVRRTPIIQEGKVVEYRNRTVPRLELTVNSDEGTGLISTPKVLLWPASFLEAVGLCLAVAATLLPRRRWLLLLACYLLNGLGLLAPLALPGQFLI